MEDFIIEIDNDGALMSFEAKLIATGYTYQIVVSVNEIEVLYEPDEERNYRAIIDDVTQASLKEKEIKLIGLIADKLQSMSN